MVNKVVYNIMKTLKHYIQLKCGEMFNINTCPQSVLINKNLKSVNICQTYRQLQSEIFFETRCTFAINNIIHRFKRLYLIENIFTIVSKKLSRTDSDYLQFICINNFLHRRTKKRRYQ